MSSITLAAADNRGYYIKKNNEHSEEGRRHEFPPTVHWLTSIVPMSHCTGEITGRLSAYTLFVSQSFCRVLLLFFSTC